MKLVRRMRMAANLTSILFGEGTSNSKDEMRGFFPFALLGVRMTVYLRCVASAVLLMAPCVYAQESSSAAPVSTAEAASSAPAVAASTDLTPFRASAGRLPFEVGVIAQGGVGLTEERNDFKFLMAGVHAGKVLYQNNHPGLLRGNFEYAVEVFPYWQSFTPKFQRSKCVAIPGSEEIACTTPYTVGGTFSGVTVLPLILRWNFATGRRISPWVQGAGGVLWTNHKYPAFGQGPLNLANDGPGSDASVWNFTPQAGVGFHYFINSRRSLDFGVNGVHISSASLGDRNPGVNASLQFSVGYSFWK